VFLYILLKSVKQERVSCRTINSRYVTFASMSFPHSWFITWFLARVTRRV